MQVGLALAVNATLTKLDMCRNPITEDGVDAISEVIQKNLSLLQVSHRVAACGGGFQINKVHDRVAVALLTQP